MKKSSLACCDHFAPFARAAYCAACACSFLAAVPISSFAQALTNVDALNDSALNVYKNGILLEPSPLVRRALFNTEIQKHYGNVLTVVTIGVLQENSTPNANRFYDSPGLHARPQTFFVALAAAYPLDQQLSVAAKASFGKSASFGLGEGLMARNETINTIAYGLALNANRIWRSKDRIGLSLSIPAKVVSGDVKLSSPLGQFDGLPFGYETKTLNLRPSATERNWELSYTNTIGKDATLVLGLRLRLNPGHDAGAPSSRGIGVRFSQDF